MGIKKLELAMAEDLSRELRTEHGLPAEGLVIIETKNPDLEISMKSIEKDGIYGYLKSLGDFNEVKI